MKSLLALSLAIFSSSWADLGSNNKPLEITINRKNDDGTNSLIRRLSPALNEATSTSIWGTLWPVIDGIVYIPYVIDSTASGYGAAFWGPFQEAIHEFNTKTNIRLIGRYKHDNYINIHAMTDSGCWSELLGLKTAESEQDVNIEIEGCNVKGIIVHELGHVLGLGHTQKREDRDDYITVHWENIAEGWESQYIKEDISRADDCGYYDYNSIMHYPSINGEMIPLNPAYTEADIGRASWTHGRLSVEDVNCLNYLYVPDTMPVRIIGNGLSRNYIRWEGGELGIFELNAHTEMNQDLLFLQDSTFEMIDPSLISLYSPTAMPTESDQITVSFQSSNWKNWYIRALLDSPLRLDYNPGDSDDFYLESSFKIRQSLNERMDFISLESIKYPGYLVELGNDDILYLKQELIGEQRNKLYLDSVSFRLECTFNHKSEYVDTCPQGKYVIYDTFGGRTNALTTSEELKCNRAPLEGLIAKGGTKRFKFHNDAVRDVVFTDCESTFDPKLQLFEVNGFDNGNLVTPDNGCDHDDCILEYYPCSNGARETIQYSSLPEGDYYLQVEPWTDGAAGGIYSVKAYCPDAIITLDIENKGESFGVYTNDNYLEPMIFAFKPDVTQDYAISDCQTSFDPKLIIYNDNFDIISSDECDYNGSINDDCLAEGYICENTNRETIVIELEGNKNYFIGIEPWHVNSLQNPEVIVHINH